MAIEDADGENSPELEGDTVDSASGRKAVVGDYSWDDYLREYGYDDSAERLYERFDTAPGSDRWGDGDVDVSLTDEDWERTGLDPSEFLGFHPNELPDRIGAISSVGERLRKRCAAQHPLDRTPVIKGYYSWEDYKKEYFYDEEGTPPTDEEGEPETFDSSEPLGFDSDRTEDVLSIAEDIAEELDERVDENTVDVNPDLDEDEFFSTAHGTTTLVNRYDLEKEVPQEKKKHFREEERYWVNKPHSYVVIFQSTKENEIKYYAIQPYVNQIEDELQEYLTGKLRTSIKYSDESTTGGSEEHRKDVIAEETYNLLERYGLYERNDSKAAPGNTLAEKLGFDPENGIGGKLVRALGYEPQGESAENLGGIAARPEDAVLEDDQKELNEYQVEKLLYYLKRDFIGYERIDPIKYDINVEDVSCDGYNSPVFVYHSDYEQIITNIYHGKEELDDFVVKLAQRSGKGISKRSPQVDCSLPDGSRAQLTLGKEVSDHGTNYTIRQFKEVPFTPVDLINWRTFSLDEMAFLWLCIENHKSLIFAGGTASGKTTSLNAVSLFIPSNTKIVSIEDTREVELPQRNWIASVTRPSFSDDDKGDVDEFDLLEAALRQRPDYIVMGEIRGEEGRTAFQVMSTGHTTYTTFHADSVGEVLKRFTTDPINVSKTMFTALDLVSIQAATRVGGHKVKRNKSLTEINHYDPENDEINVQDVFQWQAETDDFLQMGDSNTLEEIKFDRGWSHERLEDEMFKRRVVLAYLIKNGLNTYTQVAATFQAFINDPETILALMANGKLERSLEDLREMESVKINVDAEKEEMVPRPDPDEDGRAEVEEILAEAEELFEEYKGDMPDSVSDALIDIQPERSVEAEPIDETPVLEETAKQAREFEQEQTDVPSNDERDELEDDDEEVPALESADESDAFDDTDDESGGEGELESGTDAFAPADPEPSDDAGESEPNDGAVGDDGYSANGTAADDTDPADEFTGFETNGSESGDEGSTSSDDGTEDDPFVIGSDHKDDDDPVVIGNEEPDDEDVDSFVIGADNDDGDDGDEGTANDDSIDYEDDGDDEAEIDDWGFGEVADDEEE